MTTRSRLALLREFFEKKQSAVPGDPDYNAAFCRLLVTAAEAEEASIWRLDAQDRLHLIYSTDIPEEQRGAFTLRQGEGISGAAALAGETMCVADARRDPHHDRRVDEVTGLQTHSMVSSPIVFEGSRYGVLNILTFASGRSIPGEWAALLSLFALLYGAALARAKRLSPLPAPPGEPDGKKSSIVSPPDGNTSVVGISRSIREALHLCLKAGGSDIPVLIRGETGTGKELAARRIHEAGTRAEGPFLAVNCAALTETLLESELFGHRKGSFTGATRDREGKFAAAGHGTLFLDEVGEMSISSQAKILRALEEKRITPVGSDSAVVYNARIIAATNTDLAARVRQGTFREDLFYRLCGIEVVMPPLRERLEDIPLLTAHFLTLSAKQSRPGDSQAASRISGEALDLLMAYSWPGNVRQLEQALSAAAAFCEGEEIRPGDLPGWFRDALTRDSVPLKPPPREEYSRTSSEAALNEERTRYLHALEATKYAGTRRWNLSAAAQKLGIPRKTFAYRLKKLNLMREAIPSPKRIPTG